MRRTNTKQVVFIIFLWSFAVHLPGLFSPLLDNHAYRQCQTASMARNYVRHGMNFLNPEIDTAGVPQRTGTEFPIYSYILAAGFKVFGVHEILGRLLSMVLAAWGAVFLFLFVKRRLGERIALWSALVMCALPITSRRWRRLSKTSRLSVNMNTASGSLRSSLARRGSASTWRTMSYERKPTAPPWKRGSPGTATGA